MTKITMAGATERKFVEKKRFCPLSEKISFSQIHDKSLISFLGSVFWENGRMFPPVQIFLQKDTEPPELLHLQKWVEELPKDNRPLTGEGVQKFAPSIGVGMLDAMTCDIYLIKDSGSLVGRPILTACMDAYSGLCCGYSLSWEGGVYSLRGLMLNIIADKIAWCEKFGISIQKEDWDCDRLPATLVTGMGSEYKSENFEQIAELGVTMGASQILCNRAKQCK